MSAGKMEKRSVPRTSSAIRDLDPSIELLKTADSYWMLSFVFIVLIAGIVGLYAWSRSMQSAASAIPGERPAPAERSTPPTQPRISPVESARMWRDKHLAGTEFAALPIRDAEDGCFLVYTARSGDSLSAVLTRFRPYAQEDSTEWNEVCDAARVLHDLQYGHDLWPGDEIWLFLPRAGLTPGEEPPEHETPPAAGASSTSLRGI